jgi:hypothetical protein
MTPDIGLPLQQQQKTHADQCPHKNTTARYIQTRAKKPHWMFNANKKQQQQYQQQQQQQQQHKDVDECWSEL